MLDMMIAAFQRINDMEVRAAYLEAKIADLELRLSRKPKLKTTQIQLKLEFWGEEEGE